MAILNLKFNDFANGFGYGLKAGVCIGICLSAFIGGSVYYTYRANHKESK